MNCARYAIPLLTMTAAVLIASSAWAYPEFQQYSQKHSGRGVNCAMCHANPDGPEGLKPGQIGSLTPEEMNALNKARAAFEPGQNVENPVLNAFGNEIIHKLGKNRFLQIRLHPEELPTLLGNETDLDNDGICDAGEFLAGTHPLDNSHGDPKSLFLINLRRRAFHIIMMIIATATGLYGLNALLHWFDFTMRARTAPGEQGE